MAQVTAKTLDPEKQATTVQEPHPPQQIQKTYMEENKTLTNGRQPESESERIHLHGQPARSSAKSLSFISPNKEDTLNNSSGPISKSPNMDIPIGPVQKDLVSALWRLERGREDVCRKNRLTTRQPSPQVSS